MVRQDNGTVCQDNGTVWQDNGTVRRDNGAVWHIHAGARVQLRVVTPSRRHHVALTSPLPAGLEPQPQFAAGVAVEPRSGCELWHQDLRDDRADMFAQTLDRGIWSHSFLTHALTRGRFSAPGPRVEEMYTPETFARGRSEIVVIE